MLCELQEVFVCASGKSNNIAVGLKINADSGQTPHIHDETLTYRIFGEGTIVYDQADIDGTEKPRVRYKQGKQEILYMEDGLAHGAPQLSASKEEVRLTAFVIQNLYIP